MAVTGNRELVDRVRDALPAERSLREGRRFGGLRCMVHEHLAVGVLRDGGLLVRADPGRIG